MKQTFDFSQALHLLKKGGKVTRQGWQSYLYLVESSQFTVSRPPLDKLLQKGASVFYQSHIDKITPSGDDFNASRASVWQATNEDLLATDWMDG